MEKILAPHLMGMVRKNGINNLHEVFEICKMYTGELY